MTTNFYAPPSAVRGQRIVLPESEARHAHSVLRADEGQELVVVDGEGGWHRVRIDHAAPEQVVGSIIETRRDVGEPPVDVTVGIGLLTDRSRFETFVEKAVELGVRRIVPLRTRHTEADTLRRKRVRRVMIAAMKQCRRSRLPDLAPPQALDDLLARTTAALRLVCHGGGDAPPMLRVLDDEEGTDGTVLVGPEGGFSANEVERAVEAGCTPVSLGARRLRAETAGIAVVNAVLLHAQKRTAA
jgi:16S rRNA (uracil1498-N3)-methyltransferase